MEKLTGIKVEYCMNEGSSGEMLVDVVDIVHTHARARTINADERHQRMRSKGLSNKRWVLREEE